MPSHYVKTFAISIIYVKIFTFSLHAKNSIITVVIAAYVGYQSCFNRSDRCIYWPEQGNCLPIFGAFSILLHVHCAPFLSFSTKYVLLQFLTLLASMHIAIFRHFVFLMLLPFTLFSLHCSFLQFLTFFIPGRSIIVALSGDVQPRITAPFPFQNILPRPLSVKISLTDGPACWIHLVKPWICGLSSILHCRKNGPSE
jgi:hypothetical protein